MNISLDLAQFQKIWSQAQVYFSQHVLSWTMAAQIVVIGGALLLAYKISGGMRAWLRRQKEQHATNPEAGVDLVILLDCVKVIDAFLAFILLAIAYNIADHLQWRHNELYAAAMLLVGLTLVRLFTDRMKNRFGAKILAMAIWVYAFFLASLGLCNYIDFWFRFLQGVDFHLGQVHFSLLQVNRAFFLVLALYWVSKNLRKSAESTLYTHLWVLPTCFDPQTICANGPGGWVRLPRPVAAMWGLAPPAPMAREIHIPWPLGSWRSGPVP